MHLRIYAIACAILAAVACIDPEPHVVLTVEDPANLAEDATSLALGRDASDLTKVSLEGKAFPVNVTLTGFSAGERVRVWVDALAGDGSALARGITTVEFPEDGSSGTANVALNAPCSETSPAVAGCTRADDPGETGVCIDGRCGESFCGDGVVDAARGETCDDGNGDTQDACPDGDSGTCLTAECGDGFLHNGAEECDDGNDTDTDACLTSCTENRCGDGIVNSSTDELGAPLEECDDGNTQNGDGCLNTCKRNVCGDGFVDTTLDGSGNPVESCDEPFDGPLAAYCAMNPTAPACNPNDGCNACARPSWSASIVFGTGDNVSRPTLANGAPSTLTLAGTSDLALSPSGELAIADPSDNRIVAWNLAADRIVGLAGSGAAAVAESGVCDPAARRFGDGSDALVSGLSPRGIDFDDDGFLYITEYDTDPCRTLHTIRRVDPSNGTIERIGGGPTAGYTDGDALSAEFNGPSDVVAAPDGNIYVADAFNFRVRAISPGGIVTTVAGSGSCGAISTGDATSGANLCWARALALDSAGNLYVSDEQACPPAPLSCPDIDLAGDRVLRLGNVGIDPSMWTVTVVAGTGERGSSGDGGLATNATLFTPRGLTFDPGGNLYIADADNHRVRRVLANSSGLIDSLSTIETVAGDGARADSGDGGAAAVASIDRPVAVAIADGDLFIGQVDDRVRRVSLDGNFVPGTIETFTGLPADDPLAGRSPTELPLDRPRGMAFAPNGDLFVVDQPANRVYRVGSSGKFPPRGPIETFAGSGGFSVFSASFGGDNGPANEARLNQPYDVAVADDGRVFIADTANHRIRVVGADGVISTFAGTSVNVEDAIALSAGAPLGVDFIAGPVPQPTSTYGTFSGDGGQAAAATLNLPTDVEVSSDGEVYIADYGNRRIRKVDASGIISTVAGDGSLLTGGSSIGLVADMAMGVDDTLYFTSYTDDGGAPVYAIWALAPGGSAELVSTPYVGGDATRLEGIAVSPNGRIYYGYGDDDSTPGDEDEEVRSFLPGTAGFRLEAGLATRNQVPLDGLPAFRARLRSVGKMAMDGAGNWTYADEQLRHVRGVDMSKCVIDGIVYDMEFSGEGNSCDTAGDDLGVIDSIVGWLNPGDGESGYARLGSPVALYYDPDFRVWIVGDGATQPRNPPFTGGIRLGDLGTLGEEPRLSTLFGKLFGVNPDLYALEFPAFGARSPATLSQGTYGVGGIAFDASERRLFISEPGLHRIVEVSADTPQTLETVTVASYASEWLLSTPQLPCFVASCQTNTDGPLSSARFNDPQGLAVDEEAQVLYVADRGNHTLRRVDLSTADLTVSTVAGTPGVSGYAGDGTTGSLGEVRFSAPTAVAIGNDGGVYVADTGNHRIRRIDLASGHIDTVLGIGIADSTGNREAANTLPIDSPRGVAVDRFGNLFATGRTALRVVAAGEDGIATGDDLAETIYGAPPRNTIPESLTQCLSGVAADPERDERVYLLDRCQGYFIELSREDSP